MVAPLQPHTASITPAKMSVSNTVSVPCTSAATRSTPEPVSMLGRGSGSNLPPSSMLYCMKTRFQNSRKRSQSQPGAHSGRPQPSRSPRS